jgi:hypothetical protein
MPAMRMSGVFDMAEIETKVCSRCKNTKPISDFHKRSDRKRGVQSHCKQCQRIRKQQYLSTEHGASVSKLRSVRWYRANRESALLENLKWREKHRDERKQYSHDYERSRRIRSRDDVLQYKRKASNKRYRKDAKYRLNRIMGTAIRRSLGTNKGGLHWESVVGYSYEDLVRRLRSTIPDGYSWQDYRAGSTDLEIDHKVPVAAFNFASPQDEDFIRCWSLNNLQLVPRTINRIKSDKVERPFQPSLLISNWER